MAIVKVQSVTADTGPATLNGVAAGNCLTYQNTYFRGSTTGLAEALPSDSNGTFEVGRSDAPQVFGGSQDCGASGFFEKNCAAGTHTVTPEVNSGSWGTLTEWSGVDTVSPLIVGNSGKNSGTGLSQATGASASANAGDLSIISFGMAASVTGNANVGFTDPVANYTTLLKILDDASDVATFHASRVLSAGGTENATFNWTYSQLEQFWQASIFALKAAAAAGGTVIGAARPASRYVGPSVKRFLFRAPRNELFGGSILDPPGKIIGTARIANPRVGPSALRRVFRQPSFQWPVVPAGGPTTVLASLATHTYTAQAPQVQARVAPAQVSHTYTAQVPQVKARVAPSFVTHSYTTRVPQAQVRVAPAAVSHTYTARVPQVKAKVAPGFATHTYTAVVPQVKAKVAPGLATHTYTAVAPQVKVKVAPGLATHTYTARVPNIVTGSAVVPPTATHSYTARTPQAKARVAPAAMTHSYTGRAPQARSKVQPAQATHAYTARAPQARVNVQPAPTTHSYLGRVPQAKSKVAPAAAVHTYTGRIPAVASGNIVFAARATHVYAGVMPTSILASKQVFGQPVRPMAGEGSRPTQTGGSRPEQTDTNRRRN